MQMRYHIQTSKLLYLVCALAMSIKVFALSQDHDKKQNSIHKPGQFVESLKSVKAPGKAIYQSYCANCHDLKPLIPMNAPKFRDTKAWSTRVAQGKEILVKHVNEGINNMPARGGCFECQDKALWQAVEYMLPQKLVSKLK